MLISDLNNRLRAVIEERIDARELTGTDLARRAGLQQAHISNFLNSRRGLSIESMDRLMQVLGLDVRDLMPSERRAPPGVADAGFEAVPVVTPAALLQSEFAGGEVLEFLRFKKSFLRRVRPEMANQRGNWQRFAMMRADRDSGEAMRPRLLPGSMLLIDRHYNSLRPYRRRQPNMYAIDKSGNLLVRYVELQEAQLLLRPHNQQAPLASIVIRPGKSFADYIIGRVCHVAFET